MLVYVQELTNETNLFIALNASVNNANQNTTNESQIPRFFFVYLFIR